MLKTQRLHGIVDLISAAKKPADMPIKIVAIDGHGGSGKSTLAKALAKRLKAEILHVDDFASFDNPRHWGQHVIDYAFEPILQSTTKLNYPRSKWWPDHNPEPVVDQPVTPVMIFEGVSASGTDFRPYLSCSIWVETPVDICLARGVERDRNQGTLEEVTKIWQNWIEKENKYIDGENPLGYVDAVVDGTKKYE